MDDRFADWYRTVDPALRTETLENRWGVIEALAERAYLDLALDLVRLYTGAPQRGVTSATGFVGEFKKADATLPIRGNDELVRVLAGATLSAILDENDAISDATALALVSARFAGHGPATTNADLEEDADHHLVTRSRMVRSPDRETTARKVSALATRVKKVEVPVLPELGQMPNAQHFQQYNAAAENIQAYAAEMGKCLVKLRDLIAGIAKGEGTFSSTGGLEQFPEWNAAQEELNILWWLYGESSRDLGAPAADLEIEGFVLVAGKELADLTTLVPGILSAEAMMRRALRATGGALDTPIGLHALVDALPADWRRGVVEAADAPRVDLGRIAPLHLALRRSVADGEGWLPAFIGAVGLAEEPQLLPVAAARQTYTERLLGRALLAAAAAPRSNWTLGEELTGE